MSRATVRNRKGAITSPLITFFSVVGIILLGIIFWVLFKAMLGSNGLQEKLSGSETSADIAVNNFLTKSVKVEKDGAKRTMTYGELIALGAQDQEWREIMKKEMEENVEKEELFEMRTGLGKSASEVGIEIISDEEGTIFKKSYETQGDKEIFEKIVSNSDISETYEPGIVINGWKAYKDYHIPTTEGKSVRLRYYWSAYDTGKKSIEMAPWKNLPSKV